MIHIHTTGLKGNDVDLDLPRLALVVGPSGSGKSTIADAIRIAALGYVPAQGRTEAATALLLRDREFEVDFRSDNVAIQRKLSTKAKGGYTLETSTSLLASATNEEHALAALGLFGRDAHDVEEALDLRQLLALSGPQRASRIEELIAVNADPKVIGKAIQRYALQRLANVGDENMPDDAADVAPLINGWSKEGEHEGQYRALLAVWPMVWTKLKETGLAGAAAFVNERKRSTAADALQKRRAQSELAERLQAMGEPNPARVAEIEKRRGQIEQAIGADRERRQGVERRRKEIQAADRELTDAQEVLEGIRMAREQAVQHAGQLKQKRARLVEIQAALDGMPGPDRESDDDLLAREQRVAEIEAEIEAMEMPEMPDASSKIADEIERLEARLEEATNSPWSSVLASAEALLTKAGKTKGPLAVLVREESGKLRTVAMAQLSATPESIEHALEKANVRFTSAQNAEAEALKSREKALASQAELRIQARDERQAIAAERASRDASYREHMTTHREKVSRLQSERDELTAAISAMEQRETRTAEVLERAKTRLAAAEKLRKSLGDLPEAESVADLSTELNQLRGELATLQETAAAHRSLQEIIAEIEALTAENTVAAALELAIKRVRADEVAQQGGPLLALLSEYLGFAGRPEVPYVKAERSSCSLGWRRGQNEIDVAAMSGGEYALFAAGLSAAMIALRPATLRILLVESAEADDMLTGQLLRGIAGIADRLTAAVVFRHSTPGKVPKGWTVLSPDGRVAEAA